MIAIWLFGREFSDHTAKDLLALPASRAAIVAAKFTLAAAWALVLAAGTAAGGLLLGALLALPGWSVQAAAAGVVRILVAAAPPMPSLGRSGTARRAAPAGRTPGR
ncbi:ABC transporter permease [Nonomuraea mangrovi]|uniref:ABC transporter permease n=1 Tax=Nonomuraea mangrovi TaxID=2316207 RepID=A0ABW4TCB9_9ACTN